MEMRFWEDNSLQSHVKFESNSNDNIPPRSRDPFYCEAANLNFATGEDDCMDYGYRKSQVRVSRQDPMSHRIIEKRRRDRMNNCLADLSRLIPTEYLKKGRGRVEKTEIIEMAIKHMKHLQYLNSYRLGYQECVSETMRFMVEVEGHFPREPFCVRLMGHLQKHCDNICSRSSTEAQMQHPVQVPINNNNNQPSMVSETGEPKMEPNYDHGNGVEHHEEMTHERELEHEENLEKLTEREDNSAMHEHLTNGYKYKNDIKLRFTQDNAKKPKLADRRNSTPTSTDNQTCSSLGSPNPTHHLNDITMSTMPNIKHSLMHDPDRITTQSPWALSNATTADSTLNGNVPASLSSLQHVPPSVTMSNGNAHQTTGGHDTKVNFHVPVFVLHAKGSFYIPVTLDYQTLLPFLGNYDLMHHNDHHDTVLHPIAINVNFQQTHQCVLPLNLQHAKKHFDKLPS